MLSFLVQKNRKVAAKLWHSAKHRKLLSSGRPVVAVQAFSLGTSCPLTVVLENE